jgi:hypothetical protein
MTTANEAVNSAKPSLGAELAAGLGILSGNQKVPFTLYIKYILPADGFVFWVNANIARPVHPIAPALPATVEIPGSLHYSTETEQEENSTMSINTIVFTAIEKCDSFNAIDPQTMYLAQYKNVRFSFNSQGKYYQQADLWHYVGIAVTSIMETQIIDDINQLNSLKPIVSNSLPIWLAMPSYIPPYPGFICPVSKIYPSFLVPPNEEPPYISIHIEDTESLVETATLGPTLSSDQLLSETVRATLFGVNNDDSITFLNFVIQYSYDWDYIGIMNMPIVKDEKHTQSELQTIAQKKIIIFKVSYLQNVVRNIARQFILKAPVQFVPSNTLPKIRKSA